MEPTGPSPQGDFGGDSPSGPQSPQSPAGPQSPGPQSPQGVPPSSTPGIPQSPGPHAPASFAAPPASGPALASAGAVPATYGGPVPPGGWTQPMPAVASPSPVYGKKFGLGRAWGLSLLSFGLWGFYWFHTTRKQVDSELGGQRDDATLHTLGLLVPILNFFVIYWLWRDISALRERAGLSRFPEVGYLVGAIFLAPVFYSLVLTQLNEYWDRRAGGQAATAPSTTGEKAIVVVGAAFWVLWLLLIVLGIILAAAATTAVSY